MEEDAIAAEGADGPSGGVVPSAAPKMNTLSVSAGTTRSLAERMPIEPPTKAVQDFYQGQDKAAIQNKSYDALAAEYPMICYCHPDGPVKPCRLRPSGHRGRIPIWRKWLWAFPMFGWFALKYMKVGYMKKFYTDDYPKASLGIIAFASVLSVLIDAFTDPRMAIWTDNLRSRWGRRRPFIFASGMFVPVVFLLAWTPGIVSAGTAASIWFGVWHIMFKLADTLFLIPFAAWGAQLTPIYKEKTNVWQWKELFGNSGIFFGMAIAPLLFVSDACTSTPDDGCWELPMLSVFFGVIFAVSCFLLFYFGKEPSTVFQVTETKKGYTEDDTIPMLISTFLNKPFRCLLVTDIAKAVGQDIPFNVMPFMTSWVLGEKCFGSNFFGILVLVNLLAGMISVPIWTWFASYASKYRAYVCFNIALLTTTLSFIFLGFDDGSCTMSYTALALTALFGSAYGGSFLLSDLVSDIIDYDELLTGGKRREASYLMAIEFIPKFMNIPGECVPFLMMAMYNYARPVPDRYRPSCGDKFPAPSGYTSDSYCDAFYRNESVTGKRLCGDYTCAELISNGVSFICNDALETCGIKQNDTVRTILLVCFSVVPCICVLMGVLALYFYPKTARNEASQETLIQCITQIRRGQEVEDPWRPGNKIMPAPPTTEHTGILSYFWPSELKRVLEGSPPGGPLNLQALFLRPAVFLMVFVLFIPAGVVVVGLGLEDLGDDLGASVSPLGLMLIGIGILGVWFNGARFAAAVHVRKRDLPRGEFVGQYNRLCPFTGDPIVAEQ